MNKYKKIVVSIILIIIVIFLVVFLLLNKNKQDLKGNINKPIEKTGIISNIKYNVTYQQQEHVYDLSRKGYYVDGITCVDTCTYNYVYVISMGSQPSSGYSLEVVDIDIDKKKNVKVTIKENGEKDSMSYATVITFRSVSLELSEYPNSIKIVNTNGEQYKELQKYIDK